LDRRKRIVAAGGRQLILVLEKSHADMLTEVIERRRARDPKTSITSWLRLMIERDHVALLKRQAQREDAGR
jgi:hypothetical protein